MLTAQPPTKPEYIPTQPTDPLHIQWAEAACLALAECRPQDVAAICAAVLESMETGGPRHDVFGTLYSDARWWADVAPPHELVAYVIAGLARLPNRHLSILARKRAFMALWQSLPDADRAAFLAHVKDAA